MSQGSEANCPQTIEEKFIDFLRSCRGSRKLVLLIVAVALLLDNMLLTSVGKCLSNFSSHSSPVYSCRQKARALRLRTLIYLHAWSSLKEDLEKRAVSRLDFEGKPFHRPKLQLILCILSSFSIMWSAALMKVLVHELKGKVFLGFVPKMNGHKAGRTFAQVKACLLIWWHFAWVRSEWLTLSASRYSRFILLPFSGHSFTTL